MVAAGQADVVIEAGLQPYDITALIPVIEGAGGVVTSWTGGSATNGGAVVASGDPRLHEIVLKAARRLTRLLARSRHEGVEGRPELGGIDLALHQDLVAGAWIST